MKNGQSVFTRTWDKKRYSQISSISSHGMKQQQQQQQREKQNIKAGEGHQITTALSLLKSTIGPSPIFFFLSEVDELVDADR